jgi:hypothetical protein
VKDMVSSGEGADAGSAGWTCQQMLDRVALVAAVVMFFYCWRCEYPVWKP